MDAARANGFLGNLGISNSLANFLINLNHTHPQHLQNQYPFSKEKDVTTAVFTFKISKNMPWDLPDYECPIFLPTPYEIKMGILQNDL